MHVANAFSDALRITPRTDHHLVMDSQLERQPTKPSQWVNPHCLEALRLPMKNDTLIKNEKALNFSLLAYTGLLAIKRLTSVTELGIIATSHITHGH